MHRLVAGEDHHAPMRHMVLHQLLQHPTGGGVQSHEGLVKQPQTRRAQAQAGQGHATLLALRQNLQRQVLTPAQTHLVQGLQGRIGHPGLAAQGRGEVQIFQSAQTLFQGQGVTEIEHVAQKIFALMGGGLPRPQHLSIQGHRQTAQQTQQTGFPAAVVALQVQALTRQDRQVEPCKQRFATALASQIAGFQTGVGLHHM